MCNSIPILSPFFLYHPYIPHSLIRRIFLFSSLPSFLMHACIHKASRFIGGKGPRPLKIIILPDNGNVGLCVCAKFHDHTKTVLYAHSKV